MSDQLHAQNSPQEPAEELALSLWKSVSAAPEHVLPVSYLLNEYQLTRHDLQALVEALNTLSDTVSGARPCFVLSNDQLSLKGTAGTWKNPSLSPAAQELLSSLSPSRDIAAEHHHAPHPTVDLALVETDVVFGPFFQDLSAAIQDGVRCKIAYRAAHEQATTIRLVDPHALVSEEGVAYLIAWDVQQDGQRRYRMDRVASVDLTENSVEPHAYREQSIDQSFGFASHTAIVALPTRSFFDQLNWVGARPLREKPPKANPALTYVEVFYESEAWLFDQLLSHPGQIILVEPGSLYSSFLSFAQHLLDESCTDACSDLRLLS